MLFKQHIRFLALSLFTATVLAQTNTNEPHIGYLYPSGAQQGTAVEITAGGQFLRDTNEVFVSGEGVHASIIKYFKPVVNLNKEERQLIQKRLKELQEKRTAELKAKDLNSPAPKENITEKENEKTKESKKESGIDTNEVKMPELPLLYNIENKSPAELIHISNVLFGSGQRKQPNRQIAETVLIKIVIDANAPPGDRELRIRTAAGLTNPMVFQVGLLREVRELEPNKRKGAADRRNTQKLPTEQPLDLPVLLNGQIMPGDVDVFRFRAVKGQQLVIETHARSLIPYLADAVPGWFQATLALYDSGGREVAFADDYRFNPDPVLFYLIPQNGEYELEIRDSIYRGREDFVYRIAVGELPFITQMYPLGASVGVKTEAAIEGWNLPSPVLPLDTEPGDKRIRQTSCRKENLLSNLVSYAVDTLAECDENEPNNTAENAQPIRPPIIVNGRIGKPGDIDVFRFEGLAGDKIAAEVYARCLNSPLDSLLRLTDESGKVIAWNDDFVSKDEQLHKDTVGLLTHHADSYLVAELPKDGNYLVHLADSQNHGGDAYGYRLRVAEAKGDFTLRLTPSSIGVRSGATVPVCLHVLRKDGFNGEIEVALKDAPAGFKLSGSRIPAGSDRVRMTITVPREAPDKPVALQLQGIARIDGETIVRPVIPSEDVMQAFLYRHLVLSQQLLVSVQKTRWPTPPIELANNIPIRISAGGTFNVLMKTPRRPMLREIELQLNEAPKGITLRDVNVVPEGLAFKLAVEKNTFRNGFEDNLIIEAFREAPPRSQSGKVTDKKKQRISVGFLPAVPIKIVAIPNGESAGLP